MTYFGGQENFIFKIVLDGFACKLLSGHHRGRNGAPRPPKIPEKPIQPYVRFTQKVWESVKQNNPEHKVWEISKLISKMWREAADSERQIYFDEYDPVSYTHLTLPTKA